jgi:hypothetical protein
LLDEPAADRRRNGRIPAAGEGDHVGRGTGRIVSFLAANPEAGIQLGVGLRKVRIARSGGGKSGGYRTLYVFGGIHMPLFLLTVFAKNEKANLTKAEQAVAVEVSRKLIAEWSG